MSGHTVLVAGAGFSKPVGGPLLRELLDAEICAGSRARGTALDCLRWLSSPDRQGEGRSVPSLERVFTEVWDQQGTGLPLGEGSGQWNAGELLEQLQLHLGSVCGGVRFGHNVRLSRLYQKFLTSLFTESRSFTVVSFNYDTLVEQALVKSGTDFSYGPERTVVFADRSQRGGRDAGRAAVPVLKLHGSANWGICRNCGQRGPSEDLINAFEGAYLPGERRARCICGKRFLEAGIVPPVIGKGPALRSFEQFWTRARSSLKRAREVIVVGYSMPESDVQAAALLREVRSPLKRPRITVVCGPGGAPRSYKGVFGRFTDAACTFEDYLDNQYGS